MRNLNAEEDDDTVALYISGEIRERKKTWPTLHANSIPKQQQHTHLPNCHVSAFSHSINTIRFSPFSFAHTLSTTLSLSLTSQTNTHTRALFLSVHFAMASVTAFKAFVFVMVLLFVAVSAQETAPPSMSPAPAPDAGAAGSVTGSAAMIVASLVLSTLAALKFWVPIPFSRGFLHTH